MSVKRFACTEDVPAILEIWKSGFPEDGETIPLDFLKTVHLEEECLLAEEEGIPVSMVFLLPCRLCGQGGRRPVQYIYAAATLEAYRGLGIFSELLREALAVGKARGQAGSFLRPAEKSLENYYAAFGYVPFFYTATHSVRISEWKSSDNRDLPAKMDDAPDYATLRERCLSAHPLYISWEKRFVTYAVRSAEQSGGKGIRFTFPEGPGCALYDISDDSLTVRELLCPPGREDSCLRAIVRQQPCRVLRWRGPAASKNSAGVFGLWNPFTSPDKETFIPSCDRPPYMGLALD